MSYILDALKKSEQERGHGNAPSVQTVHSSSINYHNDKKSLWPYILIFAVVLNLAAIIYFIIDKETAADRATKTESTAVRNAAVKKYTPEAASAGYRPPAINVEPAPIEKNSSVKPVTLPTSATRATPKTDSIGRPDENTAPVAITEEPYSAIVTTRVIDYQDLDAAIKAQLPTITISAHIYSTNPVQRSIVINNNFLEEGEYIMDNLILHEITPNGAVLNYQGILFNYGAVSSWR